MDEIVNSKIKKIKKGTRVAFIVGIFAFIIGASLVYLHHKNIYRVDIVLFVGVPLLLLGILTALISALLAFCYFTKLGNKSEAEAYIMSRELEDSETVYIRECSTYLTPNYILTLSTKPRYVKYSDIVWVYEAPSVFRFLLQETFLLIKKRDGKTVVMAETSAIKSNSVLLQEIMYTLQERDPDIEIGYSKEFKERFRKKNGF